MLHYETHGHSRLSPVVFLHGFMGDIRDWAPAVQRLSSRFRCLTIDLPGHGKSLDVPDDTYSFPGAANAIIRVLDKAHVVTAPIVGYSMGGRIAFYLAVHHPRLCSALIIESATAGILDDRARKERRVLDEKQAHELEQGVFEEFLRTWYSQSVFASLANTPEILQEVINRRLSNDPKCLAKALTGFSVGSQPPLWEHLSSLNMPVLLVTGKKDSKYVHLVHELANQLPSASVIINPEAGHNVHVESPGRFAECVRTFLLKE